MDLSEASEIYIPPRSSCVFLYFNVKKVHLHGTEYVSKGQCSL
jgi:hypothetical protein